MPWRRGQWEWRSRSRRNPGWGRESAPFGGGGKGYREGNRACWGGLRLLRKSRGDEDLGQGGELQRWGGRPEHASQGRPKLPGGAAGLDPWRGLRGARPPTPAGLRGSPVPPGPRPLLTYLGSRGLPATPLASSGRRLVAGRPGGASGWQSAEGPPVAPGARPPPAPSASGEEGGTG